MDDVGPQKKTPTIYIVGAQCSGKTTLAMALKEHFSSNPTLPPIAVLTEAARSVLKRHDFTRNDIREDVKRCIELQRLILEAQWTEELKISDEFMLISDRSGIDPIAYAARYAHPEENKSLFDSLAWRELRTRMSRSLVIVWLKDDGVRFVPVDSNEWLEIHRSFCAHLEEADIKFCTLSADKTSTSDRVGGGRSVERICRFQADRKTRDKPQHFTP